MRVTPKDRGKKAYPADNSYIHLAQIVKRGDKKRINMRLAGSRIGTVDPAMQVTIMSRPYVKKVMSPHIGGNLYYEFVDVMHRGIMYTVLNDFTMTQPHVYPLVIIDHVSLIRP